MRRVAKVLILFLVIAVGCAGAIYYFFLKPNDNVVAAFEEGKLNLVVGGNVVISKESPELNGQEILLPLKTVKKYFDPNIYWDSKLKKVTVTTAKRVIRMKTDSLNAFINNKPVTLNVPVSISGNSVYIPIEFLSDFYNIDVKYIKENNVIVIDNKKDLKETAQVSDPRAVVRSGRSIHYPIVKKLFSADSSNADTTLRIFDEQGDWYKVRTPDGIIGYINSKYVKSKKTQMSTPSAGDKSEAVWKPSKGKINLVWDYYSKGRSSLSKAEKINGLDVLSPTWFEVSDTRGNVSNTASLGYVKWAHENGYKVWALISNNSGSINNTSEFLNNTDARDNFIRQMLAFAALYKLDGINIDFENIYKSDRDALTQFVREITPLMREQGLVVSMDVTVPDGSDNWSRCYDRAALGQVVDYVMLMTYDQYWAASPVAGSVAEIGWVEENVRKVLEQVPGRKLLLGLPFYSRLWEEKPDSSGVMELVGHGRTLTMEKERELIEENKAEVKWDEECGQFYAEYVKEGSTYRIWLEDSTSINLKSSLVQKYKLAGASSWRKDFETKDVWDVLNRNLKNVSSYKDWLQANKEASYVYK